MQKRIIIRHDSSGQHRVAENPLAWVITNGGHGPGVGRFYRIAELEDWFSGCFRCFQWR